MKKIDNKTWEKFSEAHGVITEVKAEAEQLIDELNAKLAELAEKAEAARDEAFSALDEAANDAESYYEERSEKWQEGEAGQVYSEWKDELAAARDALADAITLATGEIDGLSALDDILGALDGGFRQAPDE